VRVNGIAVSVNLARRDNDLSEFRASLPGMADGRPMMVEIDNPLATPLLFGYAEVR